MRGQMQGRRLRGKRSKCRRQKFKNLYWQRAIEKITFPDVYDAQKSNEHKTNKWSSEYRTNDQKGGSSPGSTRLF